jgi:hypothetical protein
VGVVCAPVRFHPGWKMGKTLVVIVAVAIVRC